MRIALLVDAWAPARTSAAVQMRDLARGLAAAGHAPVVLVPDASLRAPFALERDGAVEVLRLRAPRTKDIGRLRRALAESALPHAMRLALARSPHRATRWDGVAWYSPTIFFGPLVAALKRRCGCRGYLVLRDLFPDWAVDAGLLRRGAAYRYFKRVEQAQYRVADVIGVQTPANLPHLAAWRTPQRRVEVLPNWLDAPDVARAAPFASPFPGRCVFVYAGNMGAAQGMDVLLDLAAALAARSDIGFLFVGRGTEVARLQRRARDEGLANVAFRDEVEPHDVPGVLAGCDVGLVALDPRHTTHNIPGKFLTYLHAGLPVLAAINRGNDLGDVITQEDVGLACAGDDLASLVAAALQLAGDAASRAAMGGRARRLGVRDYSTASAIGVLLRGLRVEGDDR